PGLTLREGSSRVSAPARTRPSSIIAFRRERVRPGSSGASASARKRSARWPAASGGTVTTSGVSSSMPSPSTSAGKLRTLKLVVVGLGVLLVAGFLLVVVTIVQRLAGRGGEEAPAGRIEVALPAGCEVAQAWSDSGRLY